MHQYNEALEELKSISKDAYDWLAKIEPNTRSKAHFSGRAKSDILLNNHSESFNKVKILSLYLFALLFTFLPFSNS